MFAMQMFDILSFIVPIMFYCRIWHHHFFHHTGDKHMA
mgnify:CR=1 FL=1